MTESSNSPLHDPAVHAVIERVRAGGRPGGGQGRPGAGGHNERPPRDPFQFALPLKGGSELSVRL